MNETLFEVKGGFDISKDNKPYRAANGDICGYTLPDGSIVRLVVALEIEFPDGNFQISTFEDEMSEFGFNNLDYSELTFHPN